MILPKPKPKILVADPGTPTTAVDPVNVTGIGQMIIEYGNGIAMCTGTLINPRTVLFAAHCVNDADPGVYGAGSGGSAIGWGFEANIGSDNAPGEVDELDLWLYGDGAGVRPHQTNVGKAFYNGNYVSYDPTSLEPNAASFLYGDVATSSLDTPAANVPTWALLFSQLPATPITANGTGYHVTIAGYGRNGTGTSGAQDVDFRRRVAENMLGALTSIDTFEGLFGGGGGGLVQNLYWTDFDDPLRGTAGVAPYDFNAFTDDALPNEGSTAGGDSGGPLILDQTFAKSVLIGVLSGGYGGFYNDQPEDGYGAVSFYQPLYLYWNWIAANNYYHYVGAKSGDGDWADPNHWVTNLDPSYHVIANGELVNGVPDAPGGGNVAGPGFGEICNFASDCLDVASGEVTSRNNQKSANQIGQVGNHKGYAKLPAGQATAGEQPVGAVGALPAATLVNGLPGASGFVPNNYDGDRRTRQKPTYFDVTLGAAGKTTLSSMVEIDRFTMAHGGAMLDIQAGGSLTSLISITQGTGTMQVNGTLTTPGDYFMLTGGLNGTGVITTPYFTSTAGTISPGATGNVGSIGKLTFRGNTVFASGTTYLVDLGAQGTSDQIVVVAGDTAGGAANVGGRLVVSSTPGTVLQDGSTYRVLTSQNGVTGAFIKPEVSAIISSELSYLANAVDLKLNVGKYADVVDPASAVQTSYAAMMDGDRAGAYSDLAGLYSSLDMQSVDAIRGFFDGAAPRNETLRTATSLAASAATDRLYRQRIHSIQPGMASGKLEVSGIPLPTASGEGTAVAETGQTMAELADDASGYLVAGYLNGSSLPMAGVSSAGRDQFSGWYAAVGLEKAVSHQATLGFGLSYTDVNGTTAVGAQQAGSRLVQGTLYGALATDSRLRLDLRLSAGLLATDSKRSVTLEATPYALTSDQNSVTFAAEGGFGFDLAKGDRISIVPRASLRYESIGFGQLVERGGPMALAIEREAYQALESRVGMSLASKAGKVRAYLELNYAHDFLDQAKTFGASFAGGKTIAPFALGLTDNDWAEINGGLSFGLGGGSTFSIEADSTLFRSDLRSQSYRGRMNIEF